MFLCVSLSGCKCAARCPARLLAVRVSVGENGSVCVVVGRSGSVRVRVGQSGSVWVGVCQCGSVRVRVGQCGSEWVSVGQSGCRCGSEWVRVECSSKWVSMGHTRSPQGKEVTNKLCNKPAINYQVCQATIYSPPTSRCLPPTPIPKHLPKIPAGKKNQKGNNKSLIKNGSINSLTNHK